MSKRASSPVRARDPDREVAWLAGRALATHSRKRTPASQDPTSTARCSDLPDRQCQTKRAGPGALSATGAGARRQRSHSIPQRTPALEYQPTCTSPALTLSVHVSVGTQRRSRLSVEDGQGKNNLTSLASYRFFSNLLNRHYFSNNRGWYLELTPVILFPFW
jgi:hypothetical protein